jgi:hypothetical protein
VAIGEGTDMLSQQGDAHADLAEAMALGARTRDAAEALEQAIARYERKENIVMAERVRGRLAELLPAFAPAQRE